MGFQFAAAFAALFATAGNPAVPVQVAAADVQQVVPLIEPAALDRMVKAKYRIYILDVRRPAEFAQGHIKGAVLIPLNTLAANYRQVPKNVKLVVYCRTGHRSAQAVQFLRSHGYSRAVSLKGGYQAWSVMAH